MTTTVQVEVYGAGGAGGAGTGADNNVGGGGGGGSSSFDGAIFAGGGGGGGSRPGPAGSSLRTGGGGGGGGYAKKNAYTILTGTGYAVKVGKGGGISSGGVGGAGGAGLFAGGSGGNSNGGGGGGGGSTAIGGSYGDVANQGGVGGASAGGGGAGGTNGTPDHGGDSGVTPGSGATSGGVGGGAVGGGGTADSGGNSPGGGGGGTGVGGDTNGTGGGGGGGSNTTAAGSGGAGSSAGSNASGTTAGAGGAGNGGGNGGAGTPSTGGGSGGAGGAGNGNASTTYGKGGIGAKLSVTATAGQDGGVVITALLTAGITATGGTHTTDATHDIWTFTADGTWTPTFAGGPIGSDTTTVSDTPTILITRLVPSVTDSTAVTDTPTVVIAPRTFSVSDSTAVSDSTSTGIVVVGQLLVVGGGASGGGAFSDPSPINIQESGGGGAGGYVYNATYTIAAGAYTVTVGAGGANTGGPGSANQGNPSVFGATTALGGGGGGTGSVPGGGGGSGGGGGAAASGSPAGGVGTQGNNGGTGHGKGDGTIPGGAGGGGGAGAVGADGTTTTRTGGAGGNGTANSISGASVTYAGGGGGSGSAASGGGGTGGGGAAASSSADAVAGTANTGGGGGGGFGGSGSTNSRNSGAAGGSGIVILRFGTGTVNYVQSNGTVTTVGGDTVITWTVSGFFSVSDILSISDSTAVTDTPTVKIYYPARATDTTTVTESVSLSVFIPSPTYKDEPSSLITSAYKWLTSTLYAAQQGFTLRPYFTAQVVDDTIQPNAQLFSGAGFPAGNGGMATAPDGQVFAVGLDGSNALRVYRAPNLNAAGGVFPSSTALVTAGDNFLDSRNTYGISISDYYNGSYRITVWYFANFLNDGSNLTIKMHYSDDGGLTFTKVGFTPSGLANNAIGNLSLAPFKPEFLNGPDGVGMYVGCFYIKPNSAVFPSRATGATPVTGYDICYIYGDTMVGYSTDVLWYENANSYDWTIHSLAAFYLNGVQYCVFSGFRNIIDSPGVNANYALWVTALLNNTSRTLGGGSTDLWMAPVAIMPVSSASSTNLNSFTLPAATVLNGTVYITVQATVVDSVNQTAVSSAARVVSTHTNYMLVQSDNGKSYSYPSVFVGTDATEFDSAGAASFVPQGSYWYLGGLGWLWQYIQNSITADVSQDIISYGIQEAAGQPSALSLNIANANGKWVGQSPTGPGAAAIAKNRKVVVWQGYYNASGVPEAVPHSVYYIDDINQQVTSTTNDVTLVGRDLYKKLKTTVTKFSYQFFGPTFFTDIFDGTFLSSWNQIAGTWVFVASNSPYLAVNDASGGEDKIMLNNTNLNSYGHVARVTLTVPQFGGNAYIYGMYVDDNNYLRLEIDLTGGQAWVVAKVVNSVRTVLDSGTLPFTLSHLTSYTFFLRRYDYFRFSFLVSSGTGNDTTNIYDPANTSYAFKNGGTGEYDLTSTVATSPTMQMPFTLGLGEDSISGTLKWRYFMLMTFNSPNDLGSLMRKIARIAGIFSFKVSYTWRELLYTPNFAGTFTVLNRALAITAGNQAISNGNLFANGEISFRAKLAIANTGATAGFRFVFRGDSNSPTNAYYLHVIRDSSGAVFARFERLSSAAGATLRFYNSGYDATNNPTTLGSLNFDLTQWHTYRVVMIDGSFFAFIDDVMVASWNDNNSGADYLTTGNWGFAADTNTTVSAEEILAPNFWKPIQAFSLNPGDDTEGAIESLLSSLRAWMFSDMLGRFKAIFLGSANASTYTYNDQLFEQHVDTSDKEYVAQVTVYGNGVSATARDTTLMAGVPTRDVVVVDYAIITAQDAQTRATNELVNHNQYQSQYSPKQAINVGAEIFDSVTIINTGSNTSGVNAQTRVYSQEFREGGGNNNSDYSLQVDTGNL